MIRVSRIVATMLACAVASSFLLAKAFLYQVVLAADFAPGAVSQRTMAFPLELARGQILDRNMIPLTDPRTTQVVVAFPQFMKDRPLAALEMSKLLGGQATAPDVLELVSTMLAKPHSSPVEIFRGAREDIRQRFPRRGIDGLAVVPLTVRYGPRAVAQHVVGYVVQPDNSGASGIEKRFDTRKPGPGLRGRRPRSVAPVYDGAMGIIPGLGYRELPPSNRASVVLTLDIRMQRAVEAVLDANKVEKGAVVVLDPKTGEVLAMASRPSYDQNNVAASIDDVRSPLINRAVEAFYPGSVFKIVVAAAALDTATIDPGMVTVCHGTSDVGGGQPIKCSHHEKEPGLVTLRDAMAYSCNPVFIDIARRVGAGTILRYAGAFGLGKKWPEAPEGSPGALREPDSARALAHLAIGHEYVRATPLQMTQIVATVASGGVLRPPYLVKELVALNGTLLERFDHEKPRRVMSQDTAEVLADWLEAAVAYGTGAKAGVPGTSVSGKTGTPENSRSSWMEEIWDAWFVGWAPKEDPRYAVGVFIEEGKSGPDRAAPVSRDIIAALLKTGQKTP